MEFLIKINIQLLIKSNSGNPLSRKSLNKLTSVFSEQNYVVDICQIAAKKKSIDRTRKSKQEGYDQIILAGCDGTLNTIGSALTVAAYLLAYYRPAVVMDSPDTMVFRLNLKMQRMSCGREK